MRMSEIEIITDGGRRNGLAPNLLYRWRKLMLEGGSMGSVPAGGEILR